MKVLFIIGMVTLFDGTVVQHDPIAIYELKTTLEHCEKKIRPAFEQIKQTPPYTIKVVTECRKQ